MSNTNQNPAPDRTAEAENLVRLLQSLPNADKVVTLVERSEGQPWEMARQHIQMKRASLHEMLVAFVATCLKEMVESDGNKHPQPRFTDIARTFVATFWPKPTELPPNPASVTEWLRSVGSASHLAAIPAK